MEGGGQVHTLGKEGDQSALKVNGLPKLKTSESPGPSATPGPPPSKVRALGLGFRLAGERATCQPRGRVLRAGPLCVPPPVLHSSRPLMVAKVSCQDWNHQNGASLVTMERPPLPKSARHAPPGSTYPLLFPPHPDKRSTTSPFFFPHTNALGVY
ncbi:hypothetical protein DPEC_G00355590 [Dallia pectoralis]|uniref:Uncharacterized protein n=1 Tax=Dallia pectoralis TaxID=75939 RepID=A0ACC2EZI0_DALPE|nr:hypothetical protein DPEC_G00355590 [Dallia pectoralis]